MASEENSTLSKMANAAGMARGAIKTGKAIAGIAKGASAGPYGALAAGLWELRKPVTKILMAVGALLLIPVLYISLLPSLIFGTDGIGSSSGDILNDNSKIVQNIESVETQIEAALRDKHDETIKNIEVVGRGLPVHHEYSITDDFSDRIIYESTLLISQYCASEDNYKNINCNISSTYINFGKICKLQYSASSTLTGNMSYTYSKPAVALPRIISGSVNKASIAAIKRYFCSEYAAKFIASKTGIPFENLINGDYKLVIEPIAYFTHNGKNYAMTATEAALYNKLSGGALRRVLPSLTHQNLPLALFLEKSDL